MAFWCLPKKRSTQTPYLMSWIRNGVPGPPGPGLDETVPGPVATLTPQPFKQAVPPLPPGTGVPGAALQAGLLFPWTYA